MFKNQGFCFYPQYEIINRTEKTELLTFEIIDKNNFIDLFSEENINLKIICGKNGVGKTTLLRMMAKPNLYENKCVYIFKDKFNNFASSTEVKLIYNNTPINLDKIDYSIDGSCGHFCVTHENMQIEDFQFEKKITNFYREEPELYDGIIDGSLITGFLVSIWGLRDKLDLIINNSNRKSLFINDSAIFSESLFSSNIFLLYFFLQLESSYYSREYDSLIENWHEYDDNNKVSFIEFVNESLPSIDTKQYSLIMKKQKELFENEYKLEEVDKIEKVIRDLFNLIKEYFESFFGTPSDFVYSDFRDLLYFKGFNENHKTKQFIQYNNLSEGEYWSIRYRYEIFHSFTQSDGCWWYIDEPEKTLHPEWSRKFLYIYLDSYKKVREYTQKININREDDKININKRFTIVFTTHSPFMLSDLTNDYIIYLEKNNKTGLTTVAPSKKNTFAGNIFDIYYENMFMSDTIGEFSKQKINYYLTLLNENKASEDDIKYFKSLIELVGDDLLKSLLREKMHNYETNSIN